MVRIRSVDVSASPVASVTSGFSSSDAAISTVSLCATSPGAKNGLLSGGMAVMNRSASKRADQRPERYSDRPARSGSDARPRPRPSAPFPATPVHATGDTLHSLIFSVLCALDRAARCTFGLEKGITASVRIELRNGSKRGPALQPAQLLPRQAWAGRIRSADPMRSRNCSRTRSITA